MKSCVETGDLKQPQQQQQTATAVDIHTIHIKESVTKE